jgi:hypothetical protein
MHGNYLEASKWFGENQKMRQNMKQSQQQFFEKIEKMRS